MKRLGVWPLLIAATGLFALLVAGGCSDESNESETTQEPKVTQEQRLANYAKAGPQTPPVPLAVDTNGIGLPSLQATLDAKRLEYEQSAPAQMQMDFKESMELVRMAKITDAALDVGDVVPDFSLPNHLGDTIVFSDVLRDGPVVLIFYRGGWCPYCNLQLAAMQEALPKIKEYGGQLVAISPQNPDSTAATVARHGLDFIVLSDFGDHIARSFNIDYKLPPMARPHFEGRVDFKAYTDSLGSPFNMPLAVTYVIDQDGTIVWSFLDWDYRRRAEPAQVVGALRQLQGAS